MPNAIPQDASGDVVNINEDEQSSDDSDNEIDPPPAGPVSVSYGTQTDEEDWVDSAIVLKHVMPTGLVTDEDGGFLSNLITMVLPKRKNDGSEEMDAPNIPNSTTIATQTEVTEPLSARGQLLSYLLIQELAIGNRVNSKARDDIFEALCCCVAEIIEKHSILFNGMVQRLEITQFHMFAFVANELFEADPNDEVGELTITWGRVVSLFVFAVRLVRECEEEDAERIDYITRFLASYVTKYIIPFVEQKGGWESLVDEFPPPKDGNSQLRRAIVWSGSGLCVGLAATMFVSALMK